MPDGAPSKRWPAKHEWLSDTPQPTFRKDCPSTACRLRAASHISKTMGKELKSAPEYTGSYVVLHKTGFFSGNGSQEGDHD